MIFVAVIRYGFYLIKELKMLRNINKIIKKLQFNDAPGIMCKTNVRNGDKVSKAF